MVEPGIKLGIGIVIAIVVLLLLIDTIVIIGPGNRGVLVQWGAVTGQIYEEGLHFKMPIAQGINVMDVKTQKLTTDASAASKDLQTVTARIALNFRIKSTAVAWVRQNIGLDYQDKIIDPAIQESIKASTAQFTAEELISKRSQVRDLMKQILQDKLDAITNYGIVVEAFNIENFDFSPEFNQAIELKVTAEQQALAAKNKLEQVKYEAEQRIAAAQGEAEAIRIQSEALKENRDILQLRYIEKWDGKLPYFLGAGSSNTLLTIPLSIPTTNSTGSGP
jgi:regulator of protease activity HflC (stomatin/prohibitin superfamily)